MNILIIGGSCDIGISLATYYRDKGNKVIISYNKHKEDIPGVISYRCDVTKKEEIEEIFKYVIDEFGKIDILINLASISMDNSFLNKTKEEFMRVLEVNLVGMFLCNQIYSRYIDNGIIINMGSTDGIDTYSEYSIDYSTSKAGIICMSKAISKCSNNKILCICPNWIDSNSTRSMNKEYLLEELIRIGQSRLIKIEELVIGIDKIINSNYESGSIIRIDIKDDKLWIEKE